MSLSSLRTRVKNNIQNNTEVSDAQVTQWINDTQRRLCRASDFYWMESQVTVTTTDEQAEYSLPTAGDSSWTDTDSGTVKLFKAEISCHLLDSQNRRVDLKRVYQKDADVKWDYLDTDDIGTPSHYTLQRSKLKLYEAPDHDDNEDTAWTIYLNYYGYLGDLSADADTNYLVANYPDALEYGATALAWRYLFEEDKADYWEGKLKDLFEEMVLESNKYQHGTIEEGLEPQGGCGMSANKYRWNIRAHYE